MFTDVKMLKKLEITKNNIQSIIKKYEVFKK